MPRWLRSLKGHTEEDYSHLDPSTANPGSGSDSGSGPGLPSTVTSTSSNTKHEEAQEEQRNVQQTPCEAPPAYDADYTRPPSHPPPPPEHPELPPPVFKNHIKSDVNNAMPGAYWKGLKFCQKYPLDPPITSLDEGELDKVVHGKEQDMLIGEECGKGILRRYKVEVLDIRQSLGKGVGEDGISSLVKIEAKSGCRDTSFRSKRPLFLCRFQHPRMQPERGYKTVVYYEVDIVSLPNPNTGAVVAIGFSATPYPGFRLPGWHRGSGAVHSDDGRRYYNDSLGGIEGTRVIRQGDKVGSALIFHCFVDRKTGMDQVEAEHVVFLNGERQFEHWISGAVDRERLKSGAGTKRDGNVDPKHGFLGENDIYASVGVCGEGIDVRVKFYTEEKGRRIVLGG